MRIYNKCMNIKVTTFSINHKIKKEDINILAKIVPDHLIISHLYLMYVII